VFGAKQRLQRQLQWRVRVRVRQLRGHPGRGPRPPVQRHHCGLYEFIRRSSVTGRRWGFFSFPRRPQFFLDTRFRIGDDWAQVRTIGAPEAKGESWRSVAIASRCPRARSMSNQDPPANQTDAIRRVTESRSPRRQAERGTADGACGDLRQGDLSWIPAPSERPNNRLCTGAKIVRPAKPSEPNDAS
jgi:hypothetical protein